MADVELDAMKTVGDVLAKIQDPAARDRVLQWACAKFFSKSTLPPKPSRTRKPRSSGPKNPKGTSTMKVSLIKELNLRPSGKKAFKAFADVKRPKGHAEQSTVAVYYLQHELSMSGITPSHIFTCYREMNWRLPSDLPRYLTVIAYRNGYIDTSKMADIKVTSRGINLVEQDLPKKEKK